MYKQVTFTNTNRLAINKSKEGQTIEQKIAKLQKNEPIKDGAPLLFFDRKDGVRPETDIRTDRWEIAQQAATGIKRSYKAKRDEAAKEREAKIAKEQHDPGDSGNKGGEA